MPMEKKEQIMEFLFKGSNKTEIDPYWAQFFCDDFHTVGKVVTCLCDREVYYLVCTDEGYKIDVEGVWALRLEKANLDFIATSRITTPLEVRGNILSTKFYSIMKEGKDYYYFSFDYSYSGGIKELYVLKSSPVAKKMLEDSKRWSEDYSQYTSKRYILNVAYDPGIGEIVVKKIIKSGTWSMYDKDK